MKALLTTTMTALLLSTTMINAGGKKVVAPVNAPVAPIPAVVSPWPFYIGVGLLATLLERDPCPCTPDGPNQEDHRYGAVVRAGYDFNPYFGVEARWLKSLESGVFSKLEHYGLYLKPQYHVTDQSNLYALIGYGKSKVDYTNGVLQGSDDKTGLSYGVGFEYDFSKSAPEGTYTRAFDEQGDQEKGWGLWVDFLHLMDNDGPAHTDANVVMGGITYDF